MFPLYDAVILVEVLIDFYENDSHEKLYQNIDTCLKFMINFNSIYNYRKYSEESFKNSCLTITSRPNDCPLMDIQTLSKFFFVMFRWANKDDEG